MAVMRPEYKKIGTLEMRRSPAYFRIENQARQKVARQDFYAGASEMAIAQLRPQGKRFSLQFMESLPATRQQLEAEIRRMGSAEEIRQARVASVTNKYLPRVIALYELIAKINTSIVAEAERIRRKPREKRLPREEKALRSAIVVTPKIREAVDALVAELRAEPDYADEALRKDNIRNLGSLKTKYSAGAFLTSWGMARTDFAEAGREAANGARRLASIGRLDSYKRALKNLEGGKELAPADLSGLYLGLENMGQIEKERLARQRDKGENAAVERLIISRAPFVDWGIPISQQPPEIREKIKAALRISARGQKLPPELQPYLPPIRNK